MCKALDRRTGRVVALKRVPDVLQTVDAARRVLREVVVLNRLDHPNIIKIFSIFHTPATSGARVLDPDTFALVPVSVDMYMAFEYATGGDMYGLRGDMSADEVRSLMHQLASAVKYLHDVGVWHRDIKSANILCGRNRLGGRVVKVCDFGLARGAAGGGNGNPRRNGGASWTGDDPGHTARVDRDDDDDEVSFFGRSKKRRNRGSHSRSSSVSFANNGKSFAEREMLTGVVATPCYRAPEVIMSEGKYTGAMDVWALGCIFGELLQRQSAGAHTPHLTISPLFRFDDDPTLPPPGSDEMYTDYLARRDALEREETRSAERRPGAAISFGEKPQPYGANGENETTTLDAEMRDARDRDVRDSRVRARLNLFFDVIGTPSWHDVDAVSSERWRRYLRGVRGRPGNILRRFAMGRAGERAVDLLLRMLTFDPRRRASPDEILAHEYFAGLTPRARRSVGANGGVVATSAAGVEEKPRGGNGEIEAMSDAAMSDAEGGVDDRGGASTMSGVETGAGAGAGASVDSNFWEVSEPRLALSSLELAFARVGTGEAGQVGAWRDVFRRLIAKECERHTASEVDYENGASDEEEEADLIGASCVAGAPSSPSRIRRDSERFGSGDDAPIPFLSEAFPLFFRPKSRPVAYTGTEVVEHGLNTGLNAGLNADVVDVAARYLSGAPGTTGVYGQGGVGIGFGSATIGGNEARSGRAGGDGGNDEGPGRVSPALIGALQHLGLNRHGEWGELDLPTAQKKGVSFGGEEVVEVPGTWGVSAIPPGMTREEGDLYAAMSDMQSR